MDAVNAGIHLFRAVLGIVFLTFVPGFVILSLFGTHRRAWGKTTLYAVGISASFVTFLAVASSLTLTAIGFERPLTAARLTLVFGCALIALAVVAWRTGREPTVSVPSLSPESGLAFAFLNLLPIVAGAGAHLVTVQDDPTTASVAIALVALVPALVAVGAIPDELHPYAVWTTALAVLYHTNLVSTHIWGWDIHYEYYIANLITEHAFWNPAIAHSSNSLLTITVLATAYTKITGLSLVWVYKLCYPLLMSMLPVGMYYLARAEFHDEMVAALSPYVLVFYYGFFKDMPDKQYVAELFFGILLVALIDDIPVLEKRTLAALFASALVVSHYGVSFLLVAFLVTTFVGIRFVRHVTGGSTRRLTQPTFVLLVGVMWLSWYMFTAAGVNFQRVVVVTYETVQVQLLSSSSRSGAEYASRSFTSPLWVIYKNLYITLISLIGIGLMRASYSTLRTDRRSWSVEYLIFSLAVFGFLGSSVLLSFGMGFDRTLHLALVPLAPFAVLGLGTVASVVRRRASSRPTVPTVASVGFALLLVVLFLFSSGLTFAVAGESIPPYSIGLDSDAGWPVYDQSEVTATRWLESHRGDGDVAVYNRWEQFKSRDALVVNEVIPQSEMQSVLPGTTTVNGRPYVYVSKKPLQKVGSDTEYVNPERTRFARRVLDESNRIYSSDDVAVYQVTRSNQSTDKVVA